jgi:hypothetical protein
MNPKVRMNEFRIRASIASRDGERDAHPIIHWTDSLNRPSPKESSTLFSTIHEKSRRRVLTRFDGKLPRVSSPRETNQMTCRRSRTREVFDFTLQRMSGYMDMAIDMAMPLDMAGYGDGYR